MHQSATRRTLLAATAGLGCRPAGQGRAEGGPVLRLGVMSDVSGPCRDWSGPTTVACVRQAIDEMPQLRPELVQADHQNKPDLGVGTVPARFDRRDVDAVVDVNNAAIGLAVAGVARECDKVFLATGASTAALTGAQCSPDTVHWTDDTWVLATSTAAAMVQAGGDSRFFITADYAFGLQIERDARGFIAQAGGRVLGAGGFRPNPMNAGGYAAALHHLKAAADLGAARAKASGRAAVARMKAMPTDDGCFGPGTIRVDGAKLHPASLFEVKRPAESRGAFDDHRLAGIALPAAARPLAEGGCPLV